MSQTLQLAILIVGYKSRNDLEDCLTSIFQSSYKNYTVYYLNNGEDDGSAEYLQRTFPKVHVELSTDNLGFAGGNNVLINLALKERCDALFFLNPDTILHSECLASLVKYFDEDRVLQPLVLLNRNSQNTDEINTSGNPLHYAGFSYAGNNGLNRMSLYERIEPISQIMIGSGAALMVPKKIIHDVGGFNETFFTYHEDVELSYRINCAGYTIHLISNAVVWHKYVFTKNKNKFYFAERNRLLFLLQNYQIRTLFLLLPFLIFTEAMMLLYSFKGGWLNEKLRGYAYIIRTHKSTINRRKSLHPLRKMSDRQLYKLFTSKLSFLEVDNIVVKIYNVLSSCYWSIIKYV